MGVIPDDSGPDSEGCGFLIVLGRGGGGGGVTKSCVCALGAGLATPNIRMRFLKEEFDYKKEHTFARLLSVRLALSET